MGTGVSKPHDGEPYLSTLQGTRTGWLVRFCANRWASLGLVVAITLTDHVDSEQQLSFLPRALADEPCHLATAMVVLGAYTRWRGRAPGRLFVWAMLSSSVLIDLDHLPLQFGSRILTAGTPRPYTHALWVVVLSAAVAVGAGRRYRGSGSARARAVERIAAGAAWGLGAHFLRDVATAPIALWWPVSRAGVQAPYFWYVVALLVLATLPPPPGSRLRGRPSQTAGISRSWP